jgi:tRNA uridine 5-carbamoylmethylation protein Kti12
MTPPHRYHLVIGPPCSGKTTVARCRVDRLQKRGERARLLTPVFDLLFDHSDRDTANVLRREDDWAFQLDSLIEAESTGVENPGEITWVFAANACTPQLRLQYPLAVHKAGPMAWIAWWLHTPLATCRRWNSRRPLSPGCGLEEEAAAPCQLLPGRF